MAHEFDGRKYAQASTHQQEWGARLIEELELEGKESVLDLGCGDGTLTARIAELLPSGRVVGIDASRGMIEAARSKARENLSFAFMDINDLDFSAEFDVVFSNATLHWLKDHRRLYQRVGRSLRDNGRIRFNFAGERELCKFFEGHSGGNIAAGISCVFCILPVALVHAHNRRICSISEINWTD